MGEIKSNDLAKLLSCIFSKFDSEIESCIHTLEQLINENKKDTHSECKCSPKKKEELKQPHELTIGEFIILEMLNKKLIRTDIKQDDIISEVMKFIVSNPLIKLFDSCITQIDNECFTVTYTDLMSIVLNSLRNVDISKLRVN